MHRERVAHRFALRQELTLRDGSAGVSLALPPSGHCLQTAAAAPRRRLAAPAPRNKKGGLCRPRALRIARDRHSRSAPGPALGTPREAARRGHAKRRDFPRSIHSNHPLRTSPTARAPRRLRPSAWPANHRFAHRLTLALARRRRAAPLPGNPTAARAARARFALRETGTAGPPGAARRSAPRAKPRGAVTPRGEISLARYNNHRCALH